MGDVLVGCSAAVISDTCGGGRAPYRTYTATSLLLRGVLITGHYGLEPYTLWDAYRRIAYFATIYGKQR